MARRQAQPDILFLTQYYWPELIGSGPCCAALAEWLAGVGRKVKVLTCRPHYPNNRVTRSYQSGERDHEWCNGVVVERLPPWLPRRRGAAGRIASDLAFFIRGLGALLRRRVHRCEVVLCLCPSILTVLLGWAARRRGGRLIAIVHDIQSGLAAGLGIVGSRRLFRVMQAVERFALDRCDQILVLSEQMRERLEVQGVRAPIAVLPIWVDTTAIHPLPGSRPRERRNSGVTALYSGNLGRKQALDQVIDLAELLQSYQSSVRIVIRGQGTEAENLKQEVAMRGLGNVEFQSLVASHEFNQGLAEGDIHLVPQDGRAADFAVPSKVYAIMAAGRPFVATALPGSALRQLQQESQAFLCVPPGDTEAFAAALVSLAENERLRSRLGTRAREFVVRRHEKTKVLGDFLSVLHHLA